MQRYEPDKREEEKHNPSSSSVGNLREGDPREVSLETEEEGQEPDGGEERDGRQGCQELREPHGGGKHEAIAGQHQDPVSMVQDEKGEQGIDSHQQERSLSPCERFKP